LSVFVQIVLTLGVIIAIILIHRSSDKTEEFLILKLFGYYFIGSFKFNMNTLAIPLGFLIYVIAIHPKTNIQSKKNAAVLGLIIFFIGVAVPKYNDYLFTRPIEIISESTNAFDHTLNQDWVSIKNELKLDDAQIQSFQVDFERGGKIKDLKYQMVGHKGQELVHYSINLFENKKTYIIHSSRIDQMLQNYNLISANEFFDLIANVNLEEIVPEKEYPWYSIQVQGNTNALDSRYRDNVLLLTRQGVKPVTEQQYPVQGLSLTIFGMVMNSETSSSSAEFKQYLLVW